MLSFSGSKRRQTLMAVEKTDNALRRFFAYLGSFGCPPLILMVKTLKPVILSVSRSTDVPAFFSEWFLNRLRAGWCGWVNPFNKRAYRVSFENVRAAVFWTKNPAPMFERLDEIEALLPNFYFQFTLNDYEAEGLEPKLPSLEKRIEAFLRLAERLGPGRVVWRFDPLLLTPATTPADLLARVAAIGDRLVRATDRLVISFVDVMRYAKVRRSLVRETNWFSKETVGSAEPDADALRELAAGLSELAARWRQINPSFLIETCAEAADLSDWGIGHGCCIDGDRLWRLFPEDRQLRRYLMTGKMLDDDEAEPQETLVQVGGTPPAIRLCRRLKDRGQRPHCGCIASKDIGAYDTCAHFCAYCYANRSRKSVLANLDRHDPSSPFLVAPQACEPHN